MMRSGPTFIPLPIEPSCDRPKEPTVADGNHPFQSTRVHYHMPEPSAHLIQG